MQIYIFYYFSIKFSNLITGKNRETNWTLNRDWENFPTFFFFHSYYSPFIVLCENCSHWRSKIYIHEFVLKMESCVHFLSFSLNYWAWTSSFHERKWHFMENGTHYFSYRCEAWRLNFIASYKREYFFLSYWKFPFTQFLQFA